MSIQVVEDDLTSSVDMAKMKGMTKGRLDKWVKAGYLHPVQHSSRYRMFNSHDRQVVTIMVALVDAGVTVEAAYRAATNQGWLSDKVQVTIGNRHATRMWKTIRTLMDVEDERTML